MITFYIALAMAFNTTSKLHQLQKIGKFDTPQQACESSAKGEITQVIRVSYSPMTVERCCEIETAGYAMKDFYKKRCETWPSQYDCEPVSSATLMDCVSAPSYQVREVK